MEMETIEIAVEISPGIVLRSRLWMAVGPRESRARARISDEGRSDEAQRSLARHCVARWGEEHEHPSTMGLIVVGDGSREPVCDRSRHQIRIQWELVWVCSLICLFDLWVLICLFLVCSWFWWSGFCVMVGLWVVYGGLWWISGGLRWWDCGF